MRRKLPSYPMCSGEADGLDLTQLAPGAADLVRTPDTLVEESGGRGTGCQTRPNQLAGGGGCDATRSSSCSPIRRPPTVSGIRFWLAAADAVSVVAIYRVGEICRRKLRLAAAEIRREQISISNRRA